METSLEFVGLELLVQCASCAAPTPVNRAEQRTLCSNCLRETDVDDEAWAKALDGALTSFTRLGMGMSESGKLDRPGRDVEWTRGPDRPKCPSCSTGMRARADAAAAGCPGCGTERSLEQPPDFLRAKDGRIVAVLAEPPLTPSAASPKQLGMSCVQCGAAITSDGSTRTVGCPYCNTTNILPDDVWRALHPPKLRRRFWLLYALTPDPRRITPNLARETRNILFGLAGGLAFFSFMASGCTGSCVTGKNHLSGDEFLPYFPFWFGGLFLPIAFFIVLNWLRVRAIIRPDQEVVGKLVGWANGTAEVQLFDPRNPSVRLGSDTFSVNEQKYKELGAAGGLVRAWAKPRGTGFAVRPEPSGLG